MFPCGSETGLEIHRALQYSTHFEVIGASSVEDHGRFVYKRYVGGLPMHDSPDFTRSLIHTIRAERIDAIYPTMDSVAETLQQLKNELDVRVIGSSPKTTRVCASKTLTYDALEELIPTPRRYPTLSDVATYPIFIKPDRGYGSRHALRADSEHAAQAQLAQQSYQKMLLLEYLPGDEFTIDCFTDRHGTLLFHSPRGRDRISNGVSMRTSPSHAHSTTFSAWAKVISATLKPRGAWFFQAKLANDGQPRLLEVAARFAGSSALHRCLGVNLPLLSAFDAFDWPVSITPNRYPIELDRALENRYRIGLKYRHVYVDLDDCLLIGGNVNTQLIAFLFKAINEGCTITLLTRHENDLENTLARMRLRDVFDVIVHINDQSPKSAYITKQPAIFIDDSFRERAEVAARLNIPVFAPDMIEALL